MKKLLLPIVLLSGLSGAAQMPAGIDASFGTNGYSVIKPSANPSGLGKHALTPDNKIIVGGYVQGTNEDVFILKTDNNGNRETTFGNNGVSVYDPLLGGKERGGAVAVQPDGKILIAGGVKTNIDYDVLVMRVGTDGTIDANFANNGVSKMGIFGDDDAVKIAVHNNKIYIGGRSRAAGKYTDGFIIRLNMDGTLDQGFGDAGGFTLLDVNFGDQETLEDFTIMADGSIIAIGRTTKAITRQYVCKLKANGIIDSSFGQNGYFFHTEGANFAKFQSVAVNATNDIFVSGYYEVTNYDVAALWKVNADGTLNTTFASGNGRASLNLGVNNDVQFNDLVILDNGDIFLVGVHRLNGGLLHGMTAVFKSNGNIHTDYHTTGYEVAPMAQGQAQMYFGEITRLQDGNFLMTGMAEDSSSGVSMVLCRYKKETVSIHDNIEKMQDISVYPNPTNGKIMLRTGSVLKSGIDLYNTTGAKMTSLHMGADGTYDLPAHLTNGMYYIRVNTEDGTVTKQILLKR